MAKRKNTAKTKTNKAPTSLQTRKSEDVAKRLAATPFAFMKRFSEEMDNLFEDFNFRRARRGDWRSPAKDNTNAPPERLLKKLLFPFPTKEGVRQ